SGISGTSVDGDRCGGAQLRSTRASRSGPGRSSGCAGGNARTGIGTVSGSVEPAVGSGDDGRADADADAGAGSAPGVPGVLCPPTADFSALSANTAARSRGVG